MINIRKFPIVLTLLAIHSMLGCVTAPWHEQLMSNDQLIGASCSQLAAEQQRVADNARHSAESSKGGMIGAMFLVVLEGMAAASTNTPINANNSAAMNSAGLADEHTKQASELEGRKNMIDMIRSKKGCS